MYVYVLYTEYREDSGSDFNIKCVGTDLQLISDVLIECLLCVEDKLEEKIKQICGFNEPHYNISCSLRDYHLDKCLYNVFFRNYNIYTSFNIYIEKKPLIIENPKDFSDYEIYSLFYNFRLNQFVIGSIDVYPPYDRRHRNFNRDKIIQDQDVGLLSSPILDKLNKWFSYYFEESFNVIPSR